MQVREVVAYDWKYASLLLCFTGVYLALILLSLLLFLAKKCSLPTLHFMLDQTAAGRSITTERYGGKLDIDFARSKQWAKERGAKLVYVNKPEIPGQKRKKTEYKVVGQHVEN